MNSFRRHKVLKSFFVFFKTLCFDRFFCFILRIVVPINKSQNNILFVQGGGMGDMIVATGTLKHYKNFFSGRKIFLLYNTQNKGGDLAGGDMIDASISVNFGKLRRNPFYAWRIITLLRRIGFNTIIYNIKISLVHASPLFFGLDAREVFGQECESLLFLNISKEQDYYNWFVNRYIFPRIRKYFTHIIPAYPKQMRGSMAVSVLQQEIYFWEHVTRCGYDNYETYISPENNNLVSHRITKELPANFFVVALGAGAVYRCWPVDRFMDVCGDIVMAYPHLVPVLVGVSSEGYLAKRFLKFFPHALNLVGRTNIDELKYIFSRSWFLLCNETGFVHLAIALKKPSICILGCGHLGRYSHYGYPDINKWLYDKRASCVLDDWRCAEDDLSDVAPCISSISTEMVKNETRNLLLYLSNNPSAPRDKFVF